MLAKRQLALTAVFQLALGGAASAETIVKDWFSCSEVVGVGGLNTCAHAWAMFIPDWDYPTGDALLFNFDPLSNPPHPVRIISVGLFTMGQGTIPDLTRSGFYAPDWEDDATRSFWLLWGPSYSDYLTNLDATLWSAGANFRLPLNTPVDDHMYFIWRGYRDSDGFMFDCWQSSAEDNECTSVTPEPGTVSLLGVGLVLLGLCRLRVRIRSR